MKKEAAKGKNDDDGMNCNEKEGRSRGRGGDEVTICISMEDERREVEEPFFASSLDSPCPYVPVRVAAAFR